MKTSTLRPPGPPGWPVIDNTLQFATDPLGFPIRCIREYGENISLRIRGMNVFWPTNPASIETVLVTLHNQMALDRLSKGLKDALGDSLLVSDGELWERQRSLLQPAFDSRHLQRYAPVIVAKTVSMVDSWRQGQVVDVHEEMTKLALQIITKTVLDIDVTTFEGQIPEQLEILFRHVLGVLNTGIRLPAKIPTFGNLRARRAMEVLDRMIYDAIDLRRTNEEPREDLLSILFCQARMSAGGMTDRQLRDELLTMLLVGHETSALALTYTWWLLGQEPAVQDRLAVEIDKNLGEGIPSYALLNRLPLADAVFRESLRLYPPVWAMGREAQKDCEIGEYLVPSRTQILLCPWASHRNPRYFHEPDAFLPERWLGDAANAIPRYAYFPFGGGPRTCLGARFARMQVLLILTTVLRRCRLMALPDQNLALLPTVTLRPKNALLMRVTPP